MTTETKARQKLLHIKPLENIATANLDEEKRKISDEAFLTGGRKKPETVKPPKTVLTILTKEEP